MNTYKVNPGNIQRENNIGRPGKENPLPLRKDPEPEPPQTQPERLPKRKKKELFEIVMK
ncbi:MAG: hypothetical protein WD824_02135 [Cyclobacteriaceae bacterium]